MFDTGYDFFRDLLSNYGKEEAIGIANNYLDMQIKNTNHDEFVFCCELYQAIKKEEEKINV